MSEDTVLSNWVWLKPWNKINKENILWSIINEYAALYGESDSMITRMMCTVPDVLLWNLIVRPLVSGSDDLLKPRLRWYLAFHNLGFSASNTQVQSNKIYVSSCRITGHNRLCSDLVTAKSQVLPVIQNHLWGHKTQGQPIHNVFQTFP